MILTFWLNLNPRWQKKGTNNFNVMQTKVVVTTLQLRNLLTNEVRPSQKNESFQHEPKISVEHYAKNN